MNRYTVKTEEDKLIVLFNDKIEAEAKEGDAVEMVEGDDGIFFEINGYAPFKMFDDVDMEVRRELFKYIDDIHRDPKCMSCCKGYIKIIKE